MHISVGKPKLKRVFGVLKNVQSPQEHCLIGRHKHLPLIEYPLASWYCKLIPQPFAFTGVELLVTNE